MVSFMLRSFYLRELHYHHRRRRRRCCAAATATGNTVTASTTNSLHICLFFARVPIQVLQNPARVMSEMTTVKF
jgi:hypothetical protein